MINISDDIHKGHRQRMRRRFVENGEEVFDTYELLEMLLYHVVPYKDTNPLAKTLLREFGDIDGVLSASPDELMRISGIGEGVAELICSVSRLTDPASRFYLGDCECYDDYEKLCKLVAEYFSFHKGDRPCVAAFLFDNSMNLIDVRSIYDVDYSSGGVRPNRFIDYALSMRAPVLVSAHFRRYGSAIPTLGDKETNDFVTETLTAAGIRHLEHFVASDRRCVGMMTHLEKAFDEDSAISRFVESKRCYLDAEP